MYLEHTEEEQRLINLLRKNGESQEQFQARVDNALLFLHGGDSESLRDTLAYVSSGEVIYDGSR